MDIIVQCSLCGEKIKNIDIEKHKQSCKNKISEVI